MIIPIQDDASQFLEALEKGEVQEIQQDIRFGTIIAVILENGNKVVYMAPVPLEMTDNAWADFERCVRELAPPNTWRWVEL